MGYAKIRRMSPDLRYRRYFDSALRVLSDLEIVKRYLVSRIVPCVQADRQSTRFQKVCEVMTATWMVQSHTDL